MNKQGLRQLTVLDQEISRKDAQIEMLVKTLEAARREISRGGHLDRWKTVDRINDALLKIAWGK